MFLWVKLKDLMKWAISNFWNLFSFIGVIATLYVGFFYVPDYVKDMTIGKQNAIHQELVSDIQELIFYDQPITLKDVKSVISGKELAFSITYKFSSTDLLNQIQNKFLKNKFIPLKKRNELIHKIKELRVQDTKPTKPVNKSSDMAMFLSLSIGVLTGILTLLATISIFVKHRDDKELEVDISSSSESSTNNVMKARSQHIHAAYEYENMVGQVLEELSILKSDSELSSGHQLDFVAEINGKELIVEVKAYKKMLGLVTARNFTYLANSLGIGGILVAKSGVTKRTKQLIEEHNDLSDNQKIYIITGNTKQEIKQALQKMVK